MAEAVERFEVLVRHGAIGARIEIAEILGSYCAMQPSLHRYCNTPDVVDVEALLYAADRLPSSIHRVQEILIQSDAPDKLPEMAGVVRLADGARRRPTFQVGPDIIIVVAREGRTELLDLITLLCCYQLEAGKIARLLQGSKLYADLVDSLRQAPQSLEQRNRLIARLAFELGTTDDLMVALDRQWDGELLETLQALTESPPAYLARLHREYTFEASRSRAREWAANLKRGVDALGATSGPLHILSSNTHSTVNLLAAYALQVEDEIWEWATQHSVNRAMLAELNQRKPNITYFLLREWLKAHPQRVAEKQAWEQDMGVIDLADEYYTGVHAQVIQLAKVDPDKADPRLRESLLELQSSQSLLVNFDYAFGEQAGILVEQLFKAFRERVKSFSIMGKAGTVVGGRGGILLPTYLLKEGSRDVYDLPFGNALGEEDLIDLELGAVHSGGPMLTVAGTILQNEEMLIYYRENWNILGLEMEGIPYIRALHQCLKREWLCRNLQVLVGYYASDAPLEVGETLSKELDFEGIRPTYGLNLAILRKVLASEKQGHTTMEESTPCSEKASAQKL